jgi:glycosyltransferase involved in cell wall biosynthesis
MTEPRSLRLSFVIPVKNDADRLAGCLRRIAANRHSSFEIETIVADNGSSDGTRDVAAAAGARVICQPDLRVSELRNHAAAVATGSVLAFIDADHEIVPTWAVDALSVLDDESVGAAGALYLPPEGGTWVQQWYGTLRGRTVGQTDVLWLGSGNLVVRRTAFDAIGGFDASLEACEDVDFCQRLRNSGWRLVGDERLRSVHLGDPPTLHAVFRAERWRGRDNLRVTLRGRVTARDVASLAISVIDLVCLAVTAVAMLSTAVFGGRALAVAATAWIPILVLALLRAARMAARSGIRGPLGAIQAVLVALVYDAARAIALVSRAPHHRARSGRVERARAA